MRDRHAAAEGPNRRRSPIRPSGERTSRRRSGDCASSPSATFPASPTRACATAAPTAATEVVTLSPRMCSTRTTGWPLPSRRDDRARPRGPSPPWLSQCSRKRAARSPAPDPRAPEWLRNSRPREWKSATRAPLRSARVICGRFVASIRSWARRFPSARCPTCSMEWSSCGARRPLGQCPAGQGDTAPLAIYAAISIRNHGGDPGQSAGKPRGSKR